MKISESKLREAINDALSNEFSEDEAVEWALDLYNNIASFPEEKKHDLMYKVAEKLSFLYNPDSKMPDYELSCELAALGFRSEGDIADLVSMIIVAAGGDEAHDAYDKFLEDEGFYDEDDESPDFDDDED